MAGYCVVCHNERGWFWRTFIAMDWAGRPGLLGTLVEAERLGSAGRSFPSWSDRATQWRERNLRRMIEKKEETMSLGRAITRAPGEGRAVWVPGHQVTCKAQGEETGGAYSLIEVTITGEGPPQHIHKVEDEAFYVVEGEVSVQRGDETIPASPGAFVLIPRGTNHTVWNTGSTPAKILGIYSPPGFEDYFLDTGDEDKEPDAAAYIEKAMAVAEKYNLEITGPPLG